MARDFVEMQGVVTRGSSWRTEAKPAEVMLILGDGQMIGPIRIRRGDAHRAVRGPAHRVVVELTRGEAKALAHEDGEGFEWPTTHAYLVDLDSAVAKLRAGLGASSGVPVEDREKTCPRCGGEGCNDCDWAGCVPLEDEGALHAVQRDVEAFHRALDIPSRHDADGPAIRRPELRADLIMEEACETVEAITGRVAIFCFRDNPEDAGPGDLVAAIDGFCDLLCVVYGAAAEFGINLAPFWDEVHRTNMAKRGGPVREDGKRLKPPGWTPPDIAGVLRAELERLDPPASRVQDSDEGAS